MVPFTHTQNISQQYHNYSFTYLHRARPYRMKTESGLIFSNVSSYANLNSQTKC